MKRALGIVLVFVTLSGLSGCASSGLGNGPTLAMGRSTVAAGSHSQDVSARGLVVTQITETQRVYDNAAGGIPTPEPAAPQRETQLAGPTPQIPIPHGGRATLWAN